MHRDAEMIRNLSNPRTGDLITETPSLSLPGRLRLRLADIYSVSNRIWFAFRDCLDLLRLLQACLPRLA